MDVRAAVAFEAGKPLAIETVQLDGPKEGEVLVELKAPVSVTLTILPFPVRTLKACSRVSSAMKAPG